MKISSVITLSMILIQVMTAVVSAGTVWLDGLNISAAMQGWGNPGKNKSAGEHKLAIGDRRYERGYGTHAESVLYVGLDRNARSVAADVAMDGDVEGNSNASVEFLVIGDDLVLWKSGVLRAGDAARHCEVNLTGIQILLLKVGDGGMG